MRELTIREATLADEARWRELWAGYNAFYRARVPEEATVETWRRIHDPAHSLCCFLGERDGEVVGFAHTLFHDSTWDPRPTCYLEDLFVDGHARGGGVARALILAAEADARARGARRLYWLTQEYNAPARSLYDTIVPRSSFIVYRMGLD